MTASRPLLDRLLHIPELAKVVPALRPDVLHRVIQSCGLEDAAEFVALATPEQLARVLDIDIWRAGVPGKDEVFDADRFGTWLEVLMQSGAAVAAEKLMGLDLKLVVEGLSGHAAVFDRAAVAAFTMLDGTVIPERSSAQALTAEIGGYVIQAKRPVVWDAIFELLTFLDADHADYFHRLMRGSIRLAEGEREPDGLDVLLDDREQHLFDLRCDREQRRQQQGYVGPVPARAFMKAARAVQLTGNLPPDSPLALAYFRELEATFQPSDNADDSLAGQSTTFAASDPTAMAEVLEVLRDAGAIVDPPRALLASGDGEHARLALVRDHLESHPSGADGLAYLANVMMAGGSIQARPFTLPEASAAVLAICNIGLENWPSRWPAGDLVAAFQVGCTVLHRDVCMFTAKRLIDVLGDVKCSDRDIQANLRGLRRELKLGVADAAPWRARAALDAILILDATSWAALTALIDECPTMHAAMNPTNRARRISASDFQFIARNSEIAAVREFLESLPARLTD